MLWYKFWLETRWRMLLALAMLLLVLVQIHSLGNFQSRQGSPLGVFWLIPPLMLAGSGVRTDPVFLPVKGLHGSLYFTLSLPVSRLRLFAVRAGIGLLEMAALTVVLCGVAGVFLPELRVHATLAGGFIYVATVCLCSCGIYGLATLLSTFLEQPWQVWAGVAAIVFCRWLTGAVGLPYSLDPFRAMSSLAPLATHAFPWAATGVSLSAGAGFFLAAIMVVQKREY